MAIYLGGEGQFMCGVSNLSLNGNTSLEVTTPDGIPSQKKELLWTLVPYFDNDFRYKGFAIRNSANGKYIRANSGMPNGGGVSLVEKKDVDEWAAWGLGTPIPGPAACYVPLIVAANTGFICVLTLYGASDWKAGTQVITYEWRSGDSQLWFPHLNPQ